MKEVVMMKKVFAFLLASLTMAGLFACSSDDGDEIEGFDTTSICHAWYWPDEMPKNYYDLVVFNPDSTVLSVSILDTDEGERKRINATGKYTIQGNRLTIVWNPSSPAYLVEPATLELLFKIERTPEGLMMIWGYINNWTGVHGNTFYATPELDKAYQETEWLVIPE